MDAMQRMCTTCGQPVQQIGNVSLALRSGFTGVAGHSARAENKTKKDRRMLKKSCFFCALAHIRLSDFPSKIFAELRFANRQR
jgi:hypothetical protein